MSGLLDGFTEIRLAKPPRLTIRDRNISFNADTGIMLGHPSAVITYVNEETRQIALKSAQPTDHNAVPIIDRRTYITLADGTAERAILRLFDLPASQPGHTAVTYIDGHHYDDLGIIIFDAKYAITRVRPNH
ncbi:hypothetical protein [Bifidobacterium biavatii]|uniref:Uncharacterized protein n=1 Tax=Bifidobacterium biavatii DSM 23969 TaxID=1437608 RepID=A0A087A5B2_9BIFI|nr:hypothetical protein [Bifidobacterium biavatii]KFI53962.1 hypothetical protein BBIA_1313 [Bifidobacterium biavatii DSM 23969]